jgi:hypothetical protein
VLLLLLLALEEVVTAGVVLAEVVAPPVGAWIWPSVI